MAKYVFSVEIETKGKWLEDVRDALLDSLDEAALDEVFYFSEVSDDEKEQSVISWTVKEEISEHADA